jgi:hypothetical protein
MLGAAVVLCAVLAAAPATTALPVVRHLCQRSATAAAAAAAAAADH